MSLPTSWEELVSAIDPPRGSLANLALAKAPDWGLRVPEFARLATPATNPSRTTTALGVTLSEPGYFLGVWEGKVVVFHHMRETLELNAGGGHYSALVGDVRLLGSYRAEPRLCRPTNVTSRTSFTGLFTTEAVPIKPWDGIMTELSADENLERAGP